MERAGRTGAFSYESYADGSRVMVSRQLSSFLLASRPNDEGLSEHFKNDGFWEAWITLWISKNVVPGSICIDVGANYGYFTFQLAQMGCRVLAYEANPELIPYLVRSVELNDCCDRVKIINAAVTEVEGDGIDFNIAKSSANSSINTYTHTGDAFIGAVKIKATKLDTCLINYKKIDFIKMDIEGAEQLAWKGMQRLFDTNPGCVCLMELVPELYVQKAEFFFKELQQKCLIKYVDYDGGEQPIKDYSFIANDTETSRMIVLRNRLYITGF